MGTAGYIVLRLKAGKFQLECLGKVNDYFALVDDLLRRDHHNVTNGILICGA